LIFTRNVDDHVAKVVKAVDQVQKKHDKLGTLLVGISEVKAADLEKLQQTHELTTPLTISVDKEGPKAYQLGKEAAMTIVIYKRWGIIHRIFGFAETTAAGAKASDIAAAAEQALK
jgi:hypothetical protein